jgi:hypothetical protein
MPDQQRFEGRQQYFQVAAIFHPKATKEDVEDGIVPASVEIQAPKVVLAFDAEEVFLRQYKELPQEYADKFRQVQIIVIPFSGGLEENAA